MQIADLNTHTHEKQVYTKTNKKLVKKTDLDWHRLHYCGRADNIVSFKSLGTVRYVGNALQYSLIC